METLTPLAAPTKMEMEESFNKALAPPLSSGMPLSVINSDKP